MAALVSRWAARGGPRLPGSRAKTNKGASDTSRDFRAGAILILTVTSAPLEATADAFVPAVDAFDPAGDELVPGGDVSAVPPVAELPDGGPSSAMRASSLRTICVGAFRRLSAFQRAASRPR